MRKNIEVGKNYLFDPKNEAKQLESGVSVIKVLEAHRRFLKKIYTVCPVMDESESGVLINSSFVTTEERLEIMSNNPNDNVIIRYPVDIPTFSIEDVVLLANISMKIMELYKDGKYPMDDDMVIRMGALVNKIKFYAEISEKNAIVG